MWVCVCVWLILKIVWNSKNTRKIKRTKTSSNGAKGWNERTNERFMWNFSSKFCGIYYVFCLCLAISRSNICFYHENDGQLLNVMCHQIDQCKWCNENSATLYSPFPLRFGSQKYSYQLWYICTIYELIYINTNEWCSVDFRFSIEFRLFMFTLEEKELVRFTNIVRWFVWCCCWFSSHHSFLKLKAIYFSWGFFLFVFSIQKF